MPVNEIPIEVTGTKIDIVKNINCLVIHLTDSVFVASPLSIYNPQNINQLLKSNQNKLPVIIKDYAETFGFAWFFHDFYKLSNICYLSYAININKFTKFGDYTELFHNSNCAALINYYHIHGYKISLRGNNDFWVNDTPCEIKTAQFTDFSPLDKSTNAQKEIIKKFQEFIDRGFGQMNQKGHLFIAIRSNNANLFLFNNLKHTSEKQPPLAPITETITLIMNDPTNDQKIFHSFKKDDFGKFSDFIRQCSWSLEIQPNGEAQLPIGPANIIVSSNTIHYINVAYFTKRFISQIKSSSKDGIASVSSTSVTLTFKRNDKFNAS